MGIGLLAGFAAIWNVATATGPSVRTVLLNPKTTQLFPLQVSDLPAAVVDDPATTVTPVTSEEKVKDHWRPAVWAPPADVRLIGRLTVPPGVPDPEPWVRDTLWPRPMVWKPIRTKVLRRRLRATTLYRPQGIGRQWDFYLEGNGNRARGVIRATSGGGRSC